MLKDLRNLKNYTPKGELSKGHRGRFIGRLEEEFKEVEPKGRHSVVQWLKIAAAIALIISIGQFADLGTDPIEEQKSIEQAGLALFSPKLGEIERYYLNSIRYELSEVAGSDVDRDLLNGYLVKLEELDVSYKTLSKDLEKNGFCDATVNALLENLQLRMDLIKDLKEQNKTQENE